MDRRVSVWVEQVLKIARQYDNSYYASNQANRQADVLNGRHFVYEIYKCLNNISEVVGIFNSRKTGLSVTAQGVLDEIVAEGIQEYSNSAR